MKKHKSNEEFLLHHSAFFARVPGARRPAPGAMFAIL
jgi:hypothetical protein